MTRQNQTILTVKENSQALLIQEATTITRSHDMTIPLTGIVHLQGVPFQGTLTTGQERPTTIETGEAKMDPGFRFLKNRSDSKVQFCQESPEIPVGGRLRFFLDNWKKINDQWVLSVIEEGYKLEFSGHPPQTGIKQTSVQRENLNILEAEVEDLLRKDAIEMVPFQEINCGFYSTFFLVPKKNGKMRPVINLRPLNKYLRKTHFKMDTLSKVLNLVKPKDWAISLDLSDAYLHVPIFWKHRKFLRFCVNKKCYQFKALCFGSTSAPRVFTKIVAVVAAHLREQNVRLHLI